MDQLEAWSPWAAASGQDEAAMSATTIAGRDTTATDVDTTDREQTAAATAAANL